MSKYCRPEDSAKKYIDFIQYLRRYYTSDSLLTDKRLIREISNEMVNIGVGRDDDALLTDISTSIKSVGVNSQIRIQ